MAAHYKVDASKISATVTGELSRKRKVRGGKQRNEKGRTEVQDERSSAPRRSGLPLAVSSFGPLPQRQIPSRRSKNVVEVAANRRKLRKEGEQKGEKRLARFCHNLLLFSGLRRLRQDLVNLVPRLQSRCSPS